MHRGFSKKYRDGLSKKYKKEALGVGSFILRGITTALLVTVLTLFAGIIGSATGFGGLSVSRLVDIGLLLSCLVGGYRAAKESGVWLLGGITGAGYVIVGTLLLALFLPIRGWGFMQILAEGALIGLVAGAFATGTKKELGSGWSTRTARTASRSPSYFTPSYVGYGTDDRVSSEFDWGTEDVLNDDFSGNLEEENKPNETHDVVWPWDRSAMRVPDSLDTWEPESETGRPDRFDKEFADWERGEEDISGKKMGNTRSESLDILNPETEKSKPWWE